MLSKFKWRKSRRIAALLMLSGSKIGEVSQNSFVFKLADRQIQWMDGWNYSYHDNYSYSYNYTRLQHNDNCKYKCKYATLQCTNYTTLR